MAVFKCVGDIVPVEIGEGDDAVVAHVKVLGYAAYQSLHHDIAESARKGIAAEGTPEAEAFATQMNAAFDALINATVMKIDNITNSAGNALAPALGVSMTEFIRATLGGVAAEVFMGALARAVMGAHDLTDAQKKTFAFSSRSTATNAGQSGSAPDAAIGKNE